MGYLVDAAEVLKAWAQSLTSAVLCSVVGVALRERERERERENSSDERERERERERE